MPIKYSVPTIAHLHGEDLCFWDSLSMVAEHKASRQTLRNPFLRRMWETTPAMRPAWEELLRPEAQRELTTRGRKWEHRGEKFATVEDAVSELGFSDAHIAATPEGFDRALADHGPFVYFGRLQETDLLGRHYTHNLVVTGIEKQGGLYYVLYNDPRTKVPRRKEFYGFLLEFQPFLRSPGQTTGTRILHLNEGLRPTAAPSARSGQAGTQLGTTRARPSKPTATLQFSPEIINRSRPAIPKPMKFQPDIIPHSPAFKKYGFSMPAGRTEPFPDERMRVPSSLRQDFLRDYYNANPLARQSAHAEARRITDYARQQLREPFRVPLGRSEVFPRERLDVPIYQRQNYLRDYYRANPMAAARARSEARTIINWAHTAFR